MNGSPIKDLGDDAWQLDLFFSLYYGGSSWVISSLSQGMDTQLQLTKIQYNQSVIFCYLEAKH